MISPEVGAAQEVAPGVLRILAPNAGPMTHWGTNTYVVGEDDVAVIDPGPESPEHLKAIQRAIGGRPVVAIAATHAHRDHTQLAPVLNAATAAPILGFGTATEGRSDVMERLSHAGLVAGGEGVDSAFRPDERIGAGDTIDGTGWHLDVLHTPGHFAGHLSFRLGDVLFSGDHAMGWSTTLISPPDGDMAAYMASTRGLVGTGLSRLLPGHGAAVTDPDARLDELLAHRRMREAQILDALGQGPATPGDLTRCIYTNTPNNLLPAAERNVLAHLIDLVSQNLVSAAPTLSHDAVFRHL